jgi:glycosyltransferase involved in cell wall biosynthesis
VKISIGILAYNEEGLIEETLKSLSTQSLFEENTPDISIEIIVVPNGCIDNTASVAQRSLDNFFGIKLPRVSHRVCSLEQAGKSNAWNVFVHQLSDSSSDYLFLMDSDIEILNPDTLKSMLQTLDKHPEAWVAVDRPIKDVFFKEEKTALDRLSIFVSGLSGGNPKIEGPAWICGQLYCARASQLRKLVLPNHLPAQDSFLYTTIVTDGLQSEVNPHRVILAGSATHRFEAYTQLSRLLRHEKWLIVSNAINEIVFEFLRGICKEQVHIGTQIEKLNEENPNWLRQCTQEAIGKRGFWLIPRFILIRRFIALKHKSLPKALLLFPISCAAFGVDVFLAFQANQHLRKNYQVGYWGK